MPAISSLVLAVRWIEKFCRNLMYQRQIVLITNGTGEIEEEQGQLEQIATKFKENSIELVVLGVDFDDPEFGTKEEGKSKIKKANEATLKSLVDLCDGVYGTLDQAVSELGIPRIRRVAPRPSYKGKLTLGEPGKPPTMSIDVERYPRTMVARAPTASQFVAKNENAPAEGSVQSSATIVGDKSGAEGANGLVSVKNSRTYQVEDESVEGGKREVERDDLAKGYEYGRTAVHISLAEENVTKMETEKSLQILGFVPRDNYDRYMHMSVTSCIISQKANEKASMGLSSLIHALFELDSYAVARLVVGDHNKPPVLVLLAPSIEPDFECLLDVQLPFAEDLRSYRFPPLSHVVTVSGKVLNEHRNLPNDKLKQTMSDYVDAMDLSSFGEDDEGKPAEYMPLEDTFSPVLHRIDQAIRWRAVHPTEPIPPVNEILTKFSQQPPELVDRSKPQLDALVAAADVKKVPTKLQSRRKGNRRGQPPPLSGLDVGALLSRERPNTDKASMAQISRENAIPEFKQLLATTDDHGTIRTAVTQMRSIIDEQITHSLGDSAYAVAIEEMSVVREELLEFEEPEMWNEFVSGLKADLLEGKLGGERREMWWEIRRAGLGLVTRAVGRVGGVEEEEANAFLSSK
ncbi:MAG: hypothetical protein M4579_005816 [Chaenotheca gracillima]|nr:MAG: hypothetical protein M4579_005816 [Chaenotheca gracillima]